MDLDWLGALVGLAYFPPRAWRERGRFLEADVDEEPPRPYEEA